MILCRDVCTRRYLMSAEHEFSIRCEGEISGSGPGIEPSLRRKRQQKIIFQLYCVISQSDIYLI